MELSSEERTEHLNRTIKQLTADPCHLTDAQILEGLSPDQLIVTEWWMSPPTLNKIVRIVHRIKNPVLLHNLQQMWADGLATRNDSALVSECVFRSLASHPHVTEETCLELLNIPFFPIRKKVCEDLQLNTQMSARIRVLATV